MILLEAMFLLGYITKTVNVKLNDALNIPVTALHVESSNIFCQSDDRLMKQILSIFFALWFLFLQFAQIKASVCTSVNDRLNFFVRETIFHVIFN